VHGLGERHQRPARIGPLVQVGEDPPLHLIGHTRSIRGDLGDGSRRCVADIVEPWHVEPAGGGQACQRPNPALGSASSLPVTDNPAELENRLLTVTQHRDVDEVGHRLRVGRAVTADHHEWFVLGPVDAVQPDAS